MVMVLHWTAVRPTFNEQVVPAPVLPSVMVGEQQKGDPLEQVFYGIVSFKSLTVVRFSMH